MSTTANTKTNPNPGTAANGAPLPPLPADHLQHPEQWTTGGESATDSQKGFIKVLEDKNPALVPEGGIDVEGLSKSEGCEVIDALKSGKKVELGAEKESKAEGEKEGKETQAKASQKDEQGDVTAAEPEATKEMKTAKTDEAKTTSTASKRKSLSDDTQPTDSSPSADKTDQAEKKEDDMQVDSDIPGSSDGTSKDTNTTTSAPADAADGSEEGRPAKKPKTDAASTKGNGDAHNSNANGNGHTTSSPPADNLITPAEDTEAPAVPEDLGNSDKLVDAVVKNGSGTKVSKDEAKVAEDDTVPGEGHLEHPENWATGDEPATDKQKGFIKVLEKQKNAPDAAGDVESLGKSEASEKIQELKSM